MQLSQTYDVRDLDTHEYHNHTKKEEESFNNFQMPLDSPTSRQNANRDNREREYKPTTDSNQSSAKKVNLTMSLKQIKKRMSKQSIQFSKKKMTPTKNQEVDGVGTQFDLEDGFDFPSNRKNTGSLVRHSISTQFNLHENKSVETDDFHNQKHFYTERRPKNEKSIKSSSFLSKQKTDKKTHKQKQKIFEHGTGQLIRNIMLKKKQPSFNDKNGNVKKLNLSMIKISLDDNERRIGVKMRASQNKNTDRNMQQKQLKKIKRNKGTASFKSLKKMRNSGNAGNKKFGRGSFNDFNELKSIRGALVKAIGKLDSKISNF